MEEKHSLKNAYFIEIGLPNTDGRRELEKGVFEVYPFSPEAERVKHSFRTAEITLSYSIESYR